MANNFVARVKGSIKVLIGKSLAVTYNKFSCPLCGKKEAPFHPLSFYFLRNLDKHENVHSIFLAETLNLEHYTCGNCGASDRDRLYALYFNRVLSGQTKSLRVLDLAPSAQLNQFLKKKPQLNIRTADLYMSGVDDKVDITDMNAYQDGQFDIFICSHVLEHIPDDVAAMRELYRVLKPGGWGIAMVPINLGLKETCEDPSIQSEADKWKYYGQDDHVRFYSKKGFTDRLKSVGFNVNEYGIDFFGKEVFHQHAIHPRSILYIVTK